MKIKEAIIKEAIKKAIEEMEKYMEGIIKYPNPCHDPDIEASETLIEFVKEQK